MAAEAKAEEVPHDEPSSQMPASQPNAELDLFGMARMDNGVDAVMSLIEAGGADDGEAGTLSKVALKITLRAAPIGASTRPQAGQRLREGTRVYSIDAVTLAHPGGRYVTCHATEEVAA